METNQVKKTKSQQTTVETQTTQPIIQRELKGERKVHHDLFKLLPANMLKNESFTEMPRYVETEHCHFFHTVDSSGKVQTQTHEVGGHFHKIEVYHSGGVPEIRVSPAMKWVKVKKYGQSTKEAVPVAHDNHTHDVQYVFSEEVTVRQTNIEAAKALAQLEAKKPSSLDGVISK